MDYKKVLAAFLKKTLKLSEEKITELLKDDSDENTTTTALLALDSARVAALLPKEGESFSDGHKKGKAEALTALETELKEQYGVTSDAKGKELIKLLVKQAEDKGGKGPKGEITEDDVRKHPAFLKLTDDLNKKDSEWKTKLEEKEKSFKSEGNRTKAKELALSYFESLNPVLSEDATRAKNQKDTFARLVTEGYEFDFVEGQKNPLIMKNGKVEKDPHGNNLDFESFITDSATAQYDFKGNNGGGSPNNGGQGGGGGGTVKHFTKGMKAEDLSKILDNDAIPVEEKEAVFNAWEAENKAN